MQLESVRQARHDPRQLRADSGDDVEGRGAAGVQDRHQHGPGAVDVDDVGLWRGALVSISHVADVDDCAIDPFNREVIESLDKSRARIQRHIPLEFSDLLRAGRQHEVLRRYGIDDVVGRDMVRLHRLLIEIDLRLKDFSAVW